MNATFTGVHDYDDRLPDWSPDGLAAAADEMRSLRRGARAPARSRTRAALTTRSRARDRELAIAFLDVQIAELDGVSIFSAAIRRWRSARPHSASSR